MLRMENFTVLINQHVPKLPWFDPRLLRKVPSIYFLDLIYPHLGCRVCWSPSQLSWDKMRGTPWIVRQPIAGLAQIQTTSTLTPVVNLDWSIYLTSMSLDCGHSGFPPPQFRDMLVRLINLPNKYVFGLSKETGMPRGHPTMQTPYRKARTERGYLEKL